MNGYIAIYKGKQKEIWAATSYAAQCEAEKQFQAEAGRKKVKGYEISITLCERADGSTVSHVATF